MLDLTSQAFSLPVIQIVYETLRDQKEGRGSRASQGVGGGRTVVLNPYDRGELFGK